MRKILLISIIVIQAFISQGQDPSRFSPEIQEFLRSDKNSQPANGCILFVGSSSIRMWSSLSVDFEKYYVMNRGFGGSEISDVNFYFDDIVKVYHPQIVVLYAGDNDLAGGESPEEVFNDFKIFVSKITALPGNPPLLFISAKPSPARWAIRDSCEKFNTLVQEYCKSGGKVKFIDTYHSMLGKNGKPDPELYIEDSLHMSMNGYEIWKKKLNPYLKKYYDKSKIN